MHVAEYATPVEGSPFVHLHHLHCEHTVCAEFVQMGKQMCGCTQEKGRRDDGQTCAHHVLYGCEGCELKGHGMPCIERRRVQALCGSEERGNNV